MRRLAIVALIGASMLLSACSPSDSEKPAGIGFGEELFWTQVTVGDRLIDCVVYDANNGGGSISCDWGE